ncbi:MAG: zincin-like metallopeptidase domain-containing protein [Bacteroidota bacterium]
MSSAFKSKVSVFEIATKRIIDLLESGVAPWKKSWSSSIGLSPMNYDSKRCYSGINFFLLSMLDDPYFMTFNQVKKNGGSIKKGAKGEVVFYWQWTYYDANGKLTKSEDDAERKIPTLKYYRVFNAPDIEGINFDYPKPEPLRPNEKYEACEELIGSTGAKIEYSDNGQPFYSPTEDFIHMPVIGRFENSDAYYSTLLHELGHWTGADSRLNRDLSGLFGSNKYSKEELIAELTSAFVCAELKLDNDAVTSDHASYLAGWIKVLKGDSKLVITASSAAQKAANYILSNRN